MKEKISLRTEKYPENYLVLDSLQPKEWVISRDTKEICGQATKKATYQENDTMQIEAWYAPKLPYQTGPNKYYGLPGLILELKQIEGAKDKPKSEFVYTCVNIAPINEPTIIKRPSKGKPITTKELEAIWQEMERKWKEMNADGVEDLE